MRKQVLITRSDCEALGALIHPRMNVRELPKDIKDALAQVQEMALAEVGYGGKQFWHPGMKLWAVYDGDVPRDTLARATRLAFDAVGIPYDVDPKDELEKLKAHRGGHVHMRVGYGKS